MLKAIRTDISSFFERGYSDLVDDKSGDIFINASLSIINSVSDDASGDLHDVRQWSKLSSVPKNISPHPYTDTL